MNIAKILNSYEQTTLHWIAALSRYTEEQFYYKPSPDEWSLAQVYDHILQVSSVCMNNAIKCMEGKGEVKGLAIEPAIFSAMGSFPPFRLKIKKIPPGMEKVYNPQQISKEQAVEQLNHMVAEMRSLGEKLEKRCSKSRVEHWAGGWFNSGQWFHSAEMHLRHHLRQQRRIERALQ